MTGVSTLSDAITRGLGTARLLLLCDPSDPPRPPSLPGLPTDLAGVSSRQVQHVEEQAQLTAQAELLLAQVVLHQAADRLQEIQHLAETERSGRARGRSGLGRAGASPTWIMQLQ